MTKNLAQRYGILFFGFLATLTIFSFQNFSVVQSESPGPMPALPINSPLGFSDSPSQSSTPWQVSFYEAESGVLNGHAINPCATDGSNRDVGNLCGEASGRQAVTLQNPGDGISFAIRPVDAGANALVLRYSIPDASAGGGETARLELTVTNIDGVVRLKRSLKLTSRYSWGYGNAGNGVQLYNSPKLALINTVLVKPYKALANPTHLYDEIQLMEPGLVHANEVLHLSMPSQNGNATITLDFVELETVPPPMAEPQGFLSITSNLCAVNGSGAIPFDVQGSSQVFDGEDDSSYASQFNAATGTNPYNGSFAAQITQEKDYYSNKPSDPLQDEKPNEILGGLSMFQLAEHNYLALKNCMAVVGAAGSGYRGVWIPPGRFYIRGIVQLPSEITIQGAGIWYSKFVAVDTAAPVPVPQSHPTGIAGQTGNLVFINENGFQGFSSHVTLSGFSMFGNVTQRDPIDNVAGAPHPVIGIFTGNSKFENLWMEHYMGGPVMNGNSSNVNYSRLRVRDTFADGLDFYGATSNSIMENCQARSTGDDAFALWAQGGGTTETVNTGTTVSNQNSIFNSVAQVPWWGKGFAVYGGTNFNLNHNAAYDTLTMPGLSVGSEFVPAGLPSSDNVSGSISNMNIYRGGGNGFFKGSEGALLVGVMTENLNNITFENINILSPTNYGIHFKFDPTVSPTPPEGTVNNILFMGVHVVAAPTCAEVVMPLTGSAQFQNVCSCPSFGAKASSCAVTYKPLGNPSDEPFKITPTYPMSTCSLAVCNSF